MRHTHASANGSPQPGPPVGAQHGEPAPPMSGGSAPGHAGAQFATSETQASSHAIVQQKSSAPHTHISTAGSFAQPGDIVGVQQSPPIGGGGGGGLPPVGSGSGSSGGGSSPGSGIGNPP